jgi:hypothetical protein
VNLWNAIRAPVTVVSMHTNPRALRLFAMGLLLLTVLCLSGCRGGGSWFGALARGASRHVGSWLVRTGLVREDTLVDFGFVFLGLFSLIGCCCVAIVCHADARDANFAPRPLSRGRAGFASAALALGGVSGVVLFWGGMHAERSHWLGAAVPAVAGFALWGAALFARRWFTQLPLALASCAALALAAWALSEPPREERVAANKLEARGLDAEWERIDGESHVVTVRILDADDKAFETGDLAPLVAELRKLPHLKNVRCAIEVKSLPSGTVPKLRAALPGVDVSGPLNPAAFGEDFQKRQQETLERIRKAQQERWQKEAIERNQQRANQGQFGP